MGVSVLLVDDSPVIISNIEEMVSDVAGIRLLRKAGSMMEAQAQMKEMKADVIVLDIQMPGGSGIDFLKWVKHLYPDVTVIIFSNLSDDVHRAVARNAGAKYFFDKSLEFESVRDILSLLAVA